MMHQLLFSDIEYKSWSGFVFLHTNGQIYKKSELIKLMKSGIKKKVWTEEEFKQKIGSFLKPIQAYEIKEGKRHELSCSHAKGDLCVCWCGGKYHQNTGGKLN